MEKYRLTNKAENEIEKIYEYSILNFGLRTAQEYVSGLHKRFALLSDNQNWGNDYGFLKPDLCRYEYRSHSIYYQTLKEGILIAEVIAGIQWYNTTYLTKNAHFQCYGRGHCKNIAFFDRKILPGGCCPS